MKHSNKRNRRRNVYREPSASAWVALFSTWAVVIILGCFLFMYSKTESKSVVPTFSAELSEPKAEQTDLEFRLKAQLKIISSVSSLRSGEPSILIYHTHTTEAYTMTDSEQYTESSKWRTNDNNNNVVAVGEELKKILENDYGYIVIHDTTDHEPPKLSSSYERSLLTMQKYHEEYPSIVLFIDLHRDAHDTSNAPCDYITIDGKETARLMFVVGKGEKYDDKPYFQSNLAFAERLTSHLNGICPNLCRPVRVKTGRYNQHIAPNCILVETGHNANTLQQAKAAMPYLAESIVYTFSQGEIDRSDWTVN